MSKQLIYMLTCTTAGTISNNYNIQCSPNNGMTTNNFANISVNIEGTNYNTLLFNNVNVNVGDNIIINLYDSNANTVIFPNSNSSGFITSNNGATLTLTTATDIETISELNYLPNFLYCNFFTSSAITAIDANCGIFKECNSITNCGTSVFEGTFYNSNITTIPDNSFDFYMLNQVGDYFCKNFNYNGKLTILPNGSFNFENIIEVRKGFCSGFNQNGALISLPNGSFNTSNIQIIDTDFLSYFNYNGKLIGLPKNSFGLQSITTIYDNFCSYFNCQGALTKLPPHAFWFNNALLNQSVSNFFAYFNQSGSLTQAGTNMLSAQIRNITNGSISFYFNVGGSIQSSSVAAGNYFNYEIDRTMFDHTFTYFLDCDGNSVPALNNVYVTINNNYFRYNYDNNNNLIVGKPIKYEAKNVTTNTYTALGSQVNINVYNNRKQTISLQIFFDGEYITPYPDSSDKSCLFIRVTNCDFHLRADSNYSINYFTKKGIYNGIPHDFFFNCFNRFGAITHFDDLLFDFSNITNGGNNFLCKFFENSTYIDGNMNNFNISNIQVVDTLYYRTFYGANIKSELPYNIFNITNIKTLSNFCQETFLNCKFNFTPISPKITHLPENSFIFGTITSTLFAGYRMFENTIGIEHLPQYSFRFDNVYSINASNNVFSRFNYNGSLVALPYGSFVINRNSTLPPYHGFQNFNQDGKLRLGSRPNAVAIYGLNGNYTTWWYWDDNSNTSISMSITIRQNGNISINDSMYYNADYPEGWENYNRDNNILYNQKPS